MTTGPLIEIEGLRVTFQGDDGRVTAFNWATYIFTREPLAFGQWL